MSEGILDLSGADTSGFEACDPGSYNCTVYEISMTETSGQGKLPAGTPMVKVQFRATDENPDGIENRRFFTNYPIPSADYENASRVLGNFVNFLVAVGEDETKVKSKGFNLKNLQDLQGRECVVRVGREEYPKGSGEYSNPVKGVKPAGSQTSQAAASSSLI